MCLAIDIQAPLVTFRDKELRAIQKASVDRTQKRLRSQKGSSCHDGVLGDGDIECMDRLVAWLSSWIREGYA